MLFLPDSAYDEFERLSEKVAAGRMDGRTAGEQLIAACPEFLNSYPLLSQACMAAGDNDAAEAWLWKGLENLPAEPTLYCLLSAFCRAHHPEKVLSERLLEMACWKLSVADEIPPTVLNIFRDMGGPKSKMDYSSPDTYAHLAAGLESKREKEEKDDPPEVVERLLPFRLITELETGAHEIVNGEDLDDLIAHAGRCAPILHAAIRGWARFDYGTDPAVAMIAAVLGEIGSTEHLTDLLELSQRSEQPVFMHAHWAVFRIAQRFPDEALRMIRSMIPQADAGMRCAIAEQLALMPDLAGWPAALDELLEDFPDLAKSEEAAYLLLSVVHELAARGLNDKAQDAERRFLTLLDRNGARWFRESREDFVPALVMRGIDDLDLDDVCLERALMDDDDDGEAPEPKPVRPGRNDPCWCGSGKKYKKCHLEADEKTDRPPAQSAPVEEPPAPVSSDRVSAELIPQLLETVPRSTMQAAMQMYFQDDPKSVLQDPEQEPLFIQWMLFDYRLPNGRTVIEEFLHRRSRNLSPASRRQLEAWQKTRLALYEIQSVAEGRGIEVKDLLADGTYFVHDLSSSRMAVRWDCLLQRVEQLGGRYEFSGNGLHVARHVLPELLEWIEKERKKTKQTAADVIAANSHRLHRVLRQIHARKLDALEVVNFEGHRIALSKAIYEVRDEAAVLAVLRALDEFAEDTHDASAHYFGWRAVEESSEGQRQTFGSVTIQDGSLSLETNSEERLKRGSRLLELHAGRWLRHVKDEVMSLDDVKRSAMNKPGAREPKGIPAEPEREIVLRYKQQHYASWPDEPLPALSGKTPREAVRTREGRRAVEELLRDFENGEDRERKAGHAAFDFSGIRKELGLC